MNKIYTGVGARKTPWDVQAYMRAAAKRLAELGWTLRSGGANGADSAFEAGCDKGLGPKEIYLPWKGFNKNPSNLILNDSSTIIKQETINVLGKEHWNRLSQGAKNLHMRNVYQVLGVDLKTKSRFVLCWAPIIDGRPQGGTATAIKLAQNHEIPVFNLFKEGEKDRFHNFMMDNNRGCER